MMRIQCVVDRRQVLPTNGSWSWLHDTDSQPRPRGDMTVITAHVCHTQLPGHRFNICHDLLTVRVTEFRQFQSEQKFIYVKILFSFRY